MFCNSYESEDEEDEGEEIEDDDDARDGFTLRPQFFGNENIVKSPTSSKKEAAAA